MSISRRKLVSGVTLTGALGLVLLVALSASAAVGLFSSPSRDEPSSTANFIEIDPPDFILEDTSTVFAVEGSTTCGTLATKRVPMRVGAVKSAKQSFETVLSKGECKVSIEVTVPESMAADEALLDSNAECTIVVESSPVGLEGGDGVAFNVYAEGPDSCHRLNIASEVTLAPRESARPSVGGGRGPVLASVNTNNPWLFSKVRAKIIGADCCTVDMFWNEIRLGWWYDGYYAGWRSWQETDGVDPWWDIACGTPPCAYVTYLNLSNYQNHNYVHHIQPFHSDGFPLGPLHTLLSPDVEADTETKITGYYNGYATCSFPVRSYDYTPLAWALIGATPPPS